MKFYSKPEIEALALETVDVIETSADPATKDALLTAGVEEENIQVINEQIASMSNDWQW